MPTQEQNRPSARAWLVENPRSRVRLIAVGVGLACLLLTCALWRFSLAYLNLPLQESARQHAMVISERLRNYLDERLTTLKSVTEFYTLTEAMLGQTPGDVDPIRRFTPGEQPVFTSANRYLTERDFQTFCNAQMAQVPGIVTILLADTDGIPFWFAPEPALLSRQDIVYLTTDLRFTNALSLAGDARQPVLTEPLKLPFPGQGLLAAVPVVAGQKHLGFVVGILPYQDMLNELLNPTVDGDRDRSLERDFEVRIDQAGQPIYPAEKAKGKPPEDGAEALWESARATQRVGYGNQQWTVTVTPLATSRASAFNALSMSIVVLGLTLSLIGTFLIQRMLWRAVRLQSEASDQRSRLERTGMSLMQVKTQLDLILNSVDEGIVLYDEDLAPVLANPAFLAMFQMTETDATMTEGTSHHEAMVRLLGRETRYWALFEAIRRDPVRTFTDEIETPLPRDNKIRRARSFLRRAVAVNDAEDRQRGILVVFKDISMFKDIERVKDDFLSNVTHELRSPLASIKGFAEMIQRDPEMPHETREEFVSIICEESSRLQHLIEELLDLRRLQSQGQLLRVAPYDLRSLVDEVVQAAHSVMLAKNIHVEVMWSGLENTRLRGDVAQLGRALRNLVTNAVKYSPPGGTITIRGNGGIQRVSLEVSDEGTGIAEKDLPYIFDQFYRGASKGRQRGTGLGLAIVKYTVELHGGHLGVRSEVGAGTNFRIELPREFHPPAPLEPVGAEGGLGARA